MTQAAYVSQSVEGGEDDRAAYDGLHEDYVGTQHILRSVYEIALDAATGKLPLVELHAQLLKMQENSLYLMLARQVG